MANNYSLSSSMLECSKEIATEAVDVLSHLETWVEDESFDEEGSFLSFCKNEGIELTDSQVRMLENLDFIEDVFSEMEEGYTNFGFNAEAEERGIWLSADEYFDDNKASAFAAAVMKTYDLDGTTLIKTAYYCDKPRIDEFGGGTIVVTKKGRFFDDQYKLEQTARDALTEDYYLVQFTEQTGGYEFNEKFIMKVAQGRDADKDVLELMKDWRGDVDEIDEENCRGLICGGEVAIEVSGMTEIHPMEYSVLKEHLTVLAA